MYLDEVLESGKYAYEARLDKRQSSNGKDFKNKKK